MITGYRSNDGDAVKLEGDSSSSGDTLAMRNRFNVISTYGLRGQ